MSVLWYKKVFGCVNVQYLKRSNTMETIKQLNVCRSMKYFKLNNLF